MKNKIINFVLVAYVIVVLIGSIVSGFEDNVVLSLTSLASNIFKAADINNLQSIIYFIMILITYMLLAILVVLFNINIFNRQKYIIIYSILIPSVILVFCIMIKSFYGNNFSDYILPAGCGICLGIVITYAVEIFKIKRSK